MLLLSIQVARPAHGLNEVPFERDVGGVIADADDGTLRFPILRRLQRALPRGFQAGVRRLGNDETRFLGDGLHPRGGVSHPWACVRAFPSLNHGEADMS